MKITSSLLEEFAELQAEMKRLKTEEMEMRIKICDALDLAKLGTNNFLIEGVKVKAIKKVNYKLDEEQLEILYDDFTDEEREAVRFKPEIKLREYKQLDHDDSSLIDQCIIVTPATPGLEVIFPDGD